MKSIGESVTEAMNLQKKGVKETAERLGMSVNAITSIRKDRNYTKDNLVKLLADLGLEILIKQIQ